MSLPILLFAAGLGTRMGTLTADRPKPLVEVGGKALIDHALQMTAEAQTDPTVINLHYKGEMIREHLKDRSIYFSDESDGLLETGGGLRHALALLGSTPVLTMNTDAVWLGPNPILHLLEAWETKMEALLLVVEKQNVVGHLGKGDFRRDPEGRLHRGTDAVYTGLQIIRTEVLSEISQSTFSMNLAWDIIAARGGLYGSVYGGQWCDVGQPSSIPLAEAMIDV